ncbi:MAG: hypothetical protein EA427_12880 [Spirochaetaceae bacterium]|nr:MAG: hypothetical protein EA427_12880 [Spirochaetaceae bacterium]
MSFPEYENQLYVIVHPSPALVGSQLGPDDFARHYLAGSFRHYSGKVIFGRLESSFRHPFFPVDEAMEDVRPHEDGRPKATKFISVYRVLEHLDPQKLEKLYLSTPEGAVLALDPTDDMQPGGPGFLRIFAEINPVRMLALTRMNFLEFGERATDPGEMRSVPALVYTQLEFDAEGFLNDFETNPMLPSPLPRVHPSKLRDAIEDLRQRPKKPTKGLLLDSSFDNIPYKLVRHGFMFAQHGKRRFFRMPPVQEIERSNYKFWKAM